MLIFLCTNEISNQKIFCFCHSVEPGNGTLLYMNDAVGFRGWIIRGKWRRIFSGKYVQKRFRHHFLSNFLSVNCVYALVNLFL